MRPAIRAVGLASAAALVAAACARPLSTDPAPLRAPVEPRGGSGDVEILAEGALSPVEDPFVAVVRDSASFAELKSAASLALPESPPARFATRAGIVAVFLGTRSTPGYRVTLGGAHGKLEVKEERPPPDAIQEQMLTHPFVVASVPLDPAGNVALTLPERMIAELPRGLPATGRFEVTGGIAGRATSADLAGSARIVKAGRLVTAILDVHANRPEAGRLVGILTGLSGPDGAIRFGTLYESPLLPPPCRALDVTAALSSPDRMAIELRSTPCTVADAFAGSGSIEVGPPRP